jgi:hypothetical protein
MMCHKRRVVATRAGSRRGKTSPHGTAHPLNFSGIGKRAADDYFASFNQIAWPIRQAIT